MYQQNRDLISVGAYQHGSDRRIDHAIEKHPAIVDFLQQDMNEAVNLNRSLDQLRQLLGVANLNANGT
jgi:flagellum-specific ATP synthase